MTWPLLNHSFFYPSLFFLDSFVIKYFAKLMLLLIPDDIGKSDATFRDIFPGISTIGHFLRNLTAYCGSRVNAITVLRINLQREVKTNWKSGPS